MSRPPRALRDPRAALAHELRTPLSVIVGYAELLRIRSDDATRLEAALRITEAAQRLEALLERVVGGVATEAEPPADGAPAVIPVARAPASVLIVDDDPMIRRLLRVTFPPDEFQIVEARDGVEALDLIEAAEPDVMLLDWNMPNATGGDVLRALQRDRRRLPVIVLTAEPDPELQELARSLGAELFLKKPFSPTQLIRAVERLLG